MKKMQKNQKTVEQTVNTTKDSKGTEKTEHNTRIEVKNSINMDLRARGS